MLIRLALLAFAPVVCGYAQSSQDLANTDSAGRDLTKALERLDRLEKQNEQLMSEIRQLRAELQQPPQPAPTLAERMDVQEARTAELAQTKVEASQKSPILLTGMLLFNGFHNGRNGGGLQDPVTAGPAASPASTGASFRQTVLGLKFNGPDLPGGGKADGSFYMDFWAGTSSPSNHLLHIRLATLDLTWKNTTVTVGQDKPIMAPREPTSLAQVGLAPLTAAGNLWDWQPQGRIEQRFSFGQDSGLRAQAGVYETSEVYPGNSPAAFATSLERARPAYQGRFEFYTGRGVARYEIAPGFSFSDSHVAGGSASSHLVTLDWMARPNRVFEFSGAAFQGTNAAELGGLRQGFTVLPSGAVLPVRANGAWGQLSLFATPRLSFHLYSGEERDRGAGLGAGSVASNLTYAGNAIYKLAPNVLAALELSQNRTAYIGSGTRLNNHYDLALAYLF